MHLSLGTALAMRLHLQASHTQSLMCCCGQCLQGRSSTAAAAMASLLLVTLLLLPLLLPQAPHEPASCQQLVRWRAMLKEERDSADARTDAWLQANARPCPRCKTHIQRNGGCNHMVCRCGPPAGACCQRALHSCVNRRILPCEGCSQGSC
jgi:hypothetical protein